jgi:hypothetical protein
MGKIAALTTATDDLYDIFQCCGDFDTMDSNDMQTMLESVAKIIVILEEDEFTAERVLGNNAKICMTSLKTIAVTLYKAKPIREKLENLIGSLDWWSTEELIEDLHGNLFVKED